MNIAVLAANGRSGRAFVSHALAAGHSVRAGVHGSVNQLGEHPNLSVVSCDATNAHEVKRLIKGQEAVVSFIGHVKGSPSRVQTQAMHVLADAMSEEDIRRVVSLTGTGVRMPGDRISLVDRVLNAAVEIVDPQRIQDGRAHVEVLKESGLDWTVIRVLKLQNIKPKPFTLTPSGPTKWVVGRGEVAQAALQVLEENSFIRQAPIISKKQ